MKIFLFQISSKTRIWHKDSYLYPFVSAFAFAETCIVAEGAIINCVIDHLIVILEYHEKRNIENTIKSFDCDNCPNIDFGYAYWRLDYQYE